MAERSIAGHRVKSAKRARHLCHQSCLARLLFAGRGQRRPPDKTGLLPGEQRAEVFRPFYRLESSRNPGTGGVGLGLSIARDAIQGHGGEIRLEDSPMGGLRVWIRLPL